MLKDFEFKKSLGQNFINDTNIIDKIINHSQIDKNTLVIEIGPGSGVLSEKIIPLAKYAILYEIDTRLKDILLQKLNCYNNYEIIFEDILKVNLNNISNKYTFDKLYVVANLPYYITTPIIEKLTRELKPDKIVIMIQKEVADRLCASVGSREYGYITAYLNYFYDIKKLFEVSRNCFIPKPNVDSAVIELKKTLRDTKVNDVNLLDKLLKDSFKFKRKNLKNNLKNYNLEKINSILNKHNFNLNDRAEVIPLEVFIDITNELLK